MAYEKSKYKKDVTGTEMPNAYLPADVESCWGDFWEKEGLMGADAQTVLNDKSDTEKFVIVIPPPNVTGSLHLGHALTTAIEDCLTRWHRMLGHHTLWVPGTDHAGIATQAVVEKMIMKNEGKTRHDYGREGFVKKVWEWKEEYGNRITMQLRRLGGSVDWNREAFTMDANLSKAVQEFFVRKHQDGTIYRDNRLVNWSCTLKTALSDIEVDQVELTGSTMLPDPNGLVKKLPGHDGANKSYEFGVLVEFAYKFTDSDDEIVVATTRIETMLGDTGIAVHPDDPRYKKYHGKRVQHPFFDRTIPIITDGELVDMSFGTGAVKITPAHDANDFKAGKKNKLEFITILDEDGAIDAPGCKFHGMMRYDCRNAIIEELKAIGAYKGKKDNPMVLPICSRSGDIIEPRMTPQWWVDCKEMAKRSTDAVRDGSLELIPAIHNDTWFHWLDNIQDWCISRQLWWGHRIPAYSVTVDGKKMDVAKNESWVSGRTIEEATEMAAKRFNVDKSKIELKQDEDVLDTWFSSALFPFSVFGWPDNTEDMKAFYPTSLLETGHDILFFWVARMVMCGFALTDQLPFTKVYLHAMVRDAHGRKMSKSLGNVLDPIDVMEGITLKELQDKLKQGNLKESEIKIATAGQEKDYPNGIPECGSDALRFGLLAYTVQGRDVNLNVNKVVAYRNFCNKIWQATKFALMNLGADFVPTAGYCEDNAASLSFIDKWILAQLNLCIGKCNDQMKAYSFGTVVDALVKFWSMNDGSGCLCDMYIEMVKPVFRGDDETAKTASRNVIWTCLEVYLRLLHPLMPFVTEELYHRLPREEGAELISSRQFSIMIAPYPQPVAEWENNAVTEDMAMINDVFRGIRAMRNNYKMTRERPVCYCKAADAATRATLAEQLITVQTMGQCGDFNIMGADGSVPEGLVQQTVSSTITVFMTPPAINYADELKKLTKDVTPKIKSRNTLKQKMGMSIDFDAKGLKKMEKTEKKLKMACEKYGLPVSAELPPMHKALGDLLALEASNPEDPAYQAAIKSSIASIASKTPQKVADANAKKLAELNSTIAAIEANIEKCEKELKK